MTEAQKIYIREYQRVWRAKHPARSRELNREWAARHPEKVLEKNRVQRKKRKAAGKDVAYRQRPENKIRSAEKQRRIRATPQGKITHNLRCRVLRALRGKEKAETTQKLVGCSGAELVSWLEGWFQPGMTWENYGRDWHIDHHQPCASFDLTDAGQQKTCFHYLNLRPLWALDNISKGAKILREKM